MQDRGQKRIINKNIKKFKNKPLIYWTIDTAIKSKKFHDIIVSSDSNKILNISKKCNKSVLVLKRPKKLSQDKSSSEDAALHAIKWYEKKFFQIDYISLLQPTSPYRSLKTINTAMNIISNSRINAVISVKKIKSKYEANKIFTLTKNNFCKILKNKNSLKKTFAINGVFYLLKRSFFFLIK